MSRLAPIALSALLFAGPALCADEAPFEIRVIDDVTGRGVPLVELETVNAVKYVTDSAGRVALREPGLSGRKVFFSVRSHGYEFPADGFGIRGVALDVTPGGEATLKIKRLNIAERLYRVTGADIYRDSVILGRPAPIDHPLLNAQVYGSDSVLTAVYRGKVRWFWGDTLRQSYPLGNFHTTGAVSDLPSSGGLDPDDGVNLTYFTGDDGFVRGVAKMPGDGLTWLEGLTALKDATGREHLFAAFMKVKPPLTVYARGLAEWNDATNEFDKVADLQMDAPALPGGHPFLHTDDATGHVYFAKPQPFVRVRATFEDFKNPAAYEAFTCLAEGRRLDAPEFDRTADGTLRYTWKRNTPALTAQDQKRLTESGLLKPGEGLLSLRDVGGTPVIAHGGSVYWNDYRKRWITIFVEILGKPSNLGEVWYAEADSPVGPWVYAVKIATQDRQDFYNPKQHPFFDQDGGRVIYFEGTYTNTFSGNPEKTPRYEYNQLMYRLDLADPRLALPVPIYRVESADDSRLADGRASSPQPPDRIAFFVLDRPAPGAVAVYERSPGRSLTTERPAGDLAPLFYALPADAKNPPATAKPLYEFKGPAGDVSYSTDADRPGLTRAEHPLCLVWENPLRFTWTTD